MTFNADDAALAFRNMSEKACEDLPYTSQSQYDQDEARVTGEIRRLVTDVMKAHGLHQLGDADNGSAAGAALAEQAAHDYAANPSDYSERTFGASTPPAPAPIAEESAPVAQPAAQVINPQPTYAPVAQALTFEQAASPSPIEAPASRIRLVPRVARDLFGGLAAAYANRLIPTAVWESPRPVIKTPDPDFSFNGYDIAVMAAAIESRKNVMATGDPGCGKTEFFKQFGARIGLPVHKVPFDGNLTRAEIIGSFRQVATPNGSATPFVLGLIPRLMQTPCIIVLDEIDQADPDIMYTLHPALEGEGLTIQEDSGLFIPRHEHCYFVATANTKGRGSDNGLTHARFEMSEATRDRFPYWLNFTFMKEDQEARTLHKKTGIDLELCKKVVTVGTLIRTAYKTSSLSQTCSFRQMLDVAPIFSAFSDRGEMEALALGIDAVMIGRANSDDAAAIREYVKQTLAVDLDLFER